MASNKNLKDLQWLLQKLESGSINLQNVSFILSQPTSSFHQETESFIKVHISKENKDFFSCLLTQLSTMYNHNNSSLRNMEFHRVHWEVEYLQSLRALLENNPGIKHIMFRRNGFGLDCLRQFSEILKRDCNVKEIVFCESSIGPTGAELISEALKVNDNLEELQIWDDSIGLKGAEEISKMIEVNTSLKLLTVFDSSSLTAIPLISACLARNRDMEVHIWSKEKRERNSKVVEFVPEINILRIYRMTISGACRVVCALGLNTTVKTLDMTGVRLKSRWAREFRWVLEQNRTLKEVKLSRCCLKDKGVVYVSAGLFKNKSLESLELDENWFGPAGLEHLLCPLSRFTSLQCQANITLKNLTFGGQRMRIGRGGLEAILGMITTNQSVTRLGICNDQGLGPEDIVVIFKCLEKNASLKRLSLQGCQGVKGEMVLNAILETLQVNPWIEEIDLDRTPLEKAGMTEGIYQRLGQNERSAEPDIDQFKDMPMRAPRSCRVFICGQEYAGKSTICSSIADNFSSPKLPYINHVRTLVNPIEQAVSRPEGMKIKTFNDEGIKISVWNLAGQHELYSLHDLMFPGHGSASIFIIILSLFKKPNNKESKDPSEVEDDLQYWLRFIVSNSKRALQQCILPNVTIVLTHFDKVNQPSQNFQCIADSIQRLRDKFHGFVEFYPTVFTVDARSSVSVSKLAQHIKNTSKVTLQRVPQVYEICNDLVQILSDWRSEKHQKPVMTWKEFGELCQLKVPHLRVRSRSENREKIDMRRRVIASCLHQIGEVIYFEDPGLFILDFVWFFDEVIGQLVQLNPRKQGSIKNGLVSRKDLEKILHGNLHNQIPGLKAKVFESLEVSDLVRMMIKLELGYEKDPSNSNSELLVPSFLEDGRSKPQKWEFSSPDCVYAGRHLECEESGRVFLTPEFFARLQVHLHNKFMALKDQHGATYRLEKQLISININGMDIRVELGGQLNYCIDILACSTKNLTETLRLIHHLIIPTIQTLSQGTILIENIIRPECVRNLIPPRYRKTQYLKLQNLKQALLSGPADGMYDYQHTWSSVSDLGKPVLKQGFDFARDLISDDDFKEVLERRYHDLYNLASELQVPPEDDPNPNGSTHEEIDPQVEASLGGIAKGVEQVLQRLKIIQQEIRDLKQEIQGLRYYEHRLLIELHRKVDHLVNYNVQIDERKVPNMFFFVRTENYSRRLVTSIITGMTALRLHMLCEYRREMHVVEDQMGVEMMQVDNVAVKCLAPYMTKFMTLITFALKIGAHLATGMGAMIPDLSREVAHLLGSSALTGAAGAATVGAFGVMAVGASTARHRSRDIQQDQGAAQQWLLDFMRDRGCSSGKDIAEKFGLWRVKYRDNGQVAWICRRHMSLRANDVIQLPF